MCHNHRYIVHCSTTISIVSFTEWQGWAPRVLLARTAGGIQNPHQWGKQVYIEYIYLLIYNFHCCQRIILIALHNYLQSPCWFKFKLCCCSDWRVTVAEAGGKEAAALPEAEPYCFPVFRWSLILLGLAMLTGVFVVLLQLLVDWGTGTA